MQIFGIGSNELLIVFLLAAIVLGPERVVKSARWFGRTVKEIRSYLKELSSGLEEELDLIDEIKEVKRDLTQF
jgi:sec-independent protein translocase protein TatB